MRQSRPAHWERLDPDARRAAEGIAQTLTTPVRELGVEAARQLLATPPAQSPITWLDRVENFVVPTRAGQVRARFYHPPSRDVPDARPVLLYLHGGGFVLGTLEGADEVCRAIAAKSHWAVLSLEYRLAPENPYPAALEDCLDAFTWIQQSAMDLGIDPETIAVGGDSAGGNLAAALCLQLRDLGLARPVSQILVYPVVDDDFATASWSEFGDGPALTTEDAKWFWSQYLGPEHTGSVEAYAAPMNASSLHDLPPALIVTAEIDALRDDAEAYAERLRDAGVSVNAIRYPGVFHGFFTELGALAKADEAIDAVVDHLSAVRLP